MVTGCCEATYIALAEATVASLLLAKNYRRHWRRSGSSGCTFRRAGVFLAALWLDSLHGR
jgi:hypothetical protein